MANRYPLIVDTTDGNKLKEIPSGDNLQLTSNGIIGVTDVTASGTVAAGVLSATSIKKGGTEIATVAVTGSYNDLNNRPTQLSDLIDDMNVLVPGDNVGQLTNNVGYLTSVAFGDLTSTPTTLGGYGITDAATSLQGALASTALQPGANISTLFNNAGYVTAADLSNGLITVDVNNTGDLVGSVFADDSTLMIDSILAAFNLDQTIRTNVVPAANGVYDLGTVANRFKDIYISSINGPSTGNLAIDAGTSGIINIGTGASTTTVNIENAVIETFDQGTGLGVAQLTANTDLEINAGNRVKITGGVPFRFSSTTTALQLAIGAQEGDVIYNTTTSRLQMYQGSAWKDVNGNVEATAGTSNFNDVVIAGDLTVNGTLIGSAQGNHTGTLAGDIVGSVFADDSAVMVDAVNYAMFSDTLSLTPLNAEPSNPVNGMIAVADGTGWDPASNAKNTLVAYLGGAWVTVAAAA